VQDFLEPEELEENSTKHSTSIVRGMRSIDAVSSAILRAHYVMLDWMLILQML